MLNEKVDRNQWVYIHVYSTIVWYDIKFHELEALLNKHLSERDSFEAPILIQ